jgi:hypothetical protein
LRRRWARFRPSSPANLWFVYALRDQRVTRLEMLADRDDALAAAGLRR